jgi:acetylornithine deacetylase/succinyl-diaminopimelate desuccinylase-like protein
MSVETRAPDEAVLDKAENGIRRDSARIAEDRGLSVHMERSEAVLPSPLDDSVATALQQASAREGTRIPIVPSGALHDAAILAREIPTAMLFVASKDGVSHNPREYSRHEDIARATQILADAIAADT